MLCLNPDDRATIHSLYLFSDCYMCAILAYTLINYGYVCHNGTQMAKAIFIGKLIIETIIPVDSIAALRAE